MKITPTILIGHPLLGHEAAFLRRLCTDLTGLDVLIIANFVVGSSRQIDFLVVTSTTAVLIELKNYHQVVFGQTNGAWTVRDAAGSVVPDKTHNLWFQTLEESVALSDEMRADQRRKVTGPVPNGGYYKLYRAFVCFYPEIPAGSIVTRGDNRVRVRGYADVLADITSSTVAGGWSISEWELFARRALGVSPATLEAAVDARVLAGHAQLDGYRLRLERTLGAGLAPMLDTDGDARTGRDIIRDLQGGQHYLLHGPTGAAKTFHLHHLALTLAAGVREMPFLVEAKRYRGGDFRSYLRGALAPYFSGDPATLLSALNDTGRTPVLLIDALNECSESLREELLHAALAFALQFDARIVVTAQNAAVPLAGLHATSVALPLPCNIQKRQIYAFHAGIEPTPELDMLCAGFENAYDLKLAGRCHAMGTAPGTRADLYDRYVADALPAANTFVAAALLRHIAQHMHDTTSIALTRRTYDELAERFLNENDANLTLLDAASATRLVQLTPDSFSFEHELLLAYLQADGLRRKSVDSDALAAELAKARNAHLVEFVLPRIATADGRQRLIEAITDPATLERIFRGEFGPEAKTALRRSCANFIDAAIADVNNWVVDFIIEPSENGRRRLEGIAVLNRRAWPPFEHRLAALLALTLMDDDLRSSALSLLEASEARLRAEVVARSTESGFRFADTWSELMRFHGGVLSGPDMLPCAKLLATLHGHMRPFATDPAFAPTRAALLERATTAPSSDFALHLLLEDLDFMTSSERVEANLDLIERAWASGVYTLQLNALNALQVMHHALTQADPAFMSRALALLATFETKHWMLDSLVAEIASIYEAIPPPVPVKDALAQLRACIAPGASEDAGIVALAEYESTPVLHVLASNAYHLLGRLFEDVFQRSYYDAYHALDDDERYALLALAAQSPDRGSHSDWILRELLACGRPESLPRFAAIVERVDFTTGFLQSEVAAALIAIEACARWGTEAPPFGTTTPEYAAAFDAVARALFTAYRSNASAGETEAVRTTWRALEGDGRLAAAAIVTAVHSAMTMFLPGDREAHRTLTTRWPREVEAVLLDCIVRRDDLGDRYRRHNYDGTLIRHAVETVGLIGSSQSSDVLRTLCEDPAFGADAVKALATLQRRGIGVV